MPRTQVAISTVNGVVGGVSYRIAPQDSVRKAVNFDFDEELGSAVTRKGCTVQANGQLMAEDNTILGLYHFVDSEAGANSQLLAGANIVGDATASIFYNNAGTWTATSTGLTAGAKMRFETFLDAVVMVNGSEVRSWAGTGAWLTTGGPFDLANMPIGKYVTIYKDQVVTSGVSGDPDTLHISSIPTAGAVSWTTNNRTITINPEDSSNIMGHGEIGGILVVLKRFGMYTWNNRATEPDQLCTVGCSSNESIVVGGDTMFFFNEQGVWATKGSYPILISRKVQPWIDGMSANFYENVNAHANNKHVFFSIGDCTVDGETYANVVLRYSLHTKEWSVRSYANEFRVFARYQSSNEVQILGGDTTARVLQLDNGDDDNGTPISYELETHDFDGGSEAVEWSVGRYIYAFGDNPNRDSVQMKVDSGDWKEVGTLSDSVNRFQKPSEINTGHTFRMRVAGTRSQGQTTFRGFEIPQLDPIGHAD